MNALDVDIPALDDYTSTIYSGIIDNATEQLNALKEAEEEARKAAEEVAKQAARNSARRSSGGGRSSSRSSTDSDTDSSSDKTIDIAGLFGGNADKTEDGESQQATTVQAKKAAGNTKKTGGKKTSNTAKTTGAKKTTSANKAAGSNARTRTATTQASSYLTGQAQTTETPYAAAQQTQNSARRTVTRASNSERGNDNTDTQYWSAAARAAVNSGDNETAYQVVNNYLEQNENARRLWNLDGRTARGSRAQTEARNRMTEQELQTYDQMRELYNSYGPLWSAAHRIGSDLTGLAQQVGGSFVTLGESIIPAIADAADQVAAQSTVNDLVRRGEAYERDASGNVIETPTMQRAQQDYERGLANTVSLDPENSLGLQLYNAGAENLANAQLGLDDGARFGVNLANAVIGNAPTMAAAAIPGVGPAVSLGLAGAQAAGGRTAELSNEGAGASEALGRGLLSGGIEAATEILPVGSWVNILNTSQGRSVARSILQQMGSEATEEGVSYLANTVADMAAQDPNAQFSLEELAQNMVMGGLSGGIYGGAGQLIGNRMNPAYRTEFGGTQNIARQTGAEASQAALLGLNDTFVTPQNQAATAQQSAVPALDMDAPTQYNAVNNVQGGAPNGTEANPDLGGNVPANLETGDPGGAGAERQPAVPGGTAAGENGTARGSAAQEAVNYAQRAQDVTGRDRRSQYTRSLQSLYERMAGGNVDAAAIDSEIDNIARGIVREADYTVEADPAQQELRNYLRNTRIYVNPQNVSEILNATGLRSVSQYNIQNGLNLTTNPDGAVPLDTTLQELSGMNVGYAGDGASPVDDLMQIAPRPRQQVDSDLLQANIDYTKEIIRDNFSGVSVPTFEEWLAQNNVSNEWGDAPDYIQRVADRYGIEHRVESYDDDFGFDSLPEVNLQGESLSQGIDQLWDGTSGNRPAQSVGADMLRDYNRAEVPNLDPGVQQWAAGILPEQERQGLGLGEQTHEVYSFREAADAGRSDVDVAVQQNNGDELAAIDQLSNELANKKQWDATDTATAQDMSRRLQNQMLMADPNSTEYGQIKERLKLLYERSSQAASRQGRALAQNRAAEFTEQTPFQKFQQVSDQIAKSWENSHKRDAQNVRNLANDIVDAGQEIPSPQDAEFDSFLRSEGITPTTDSIEDHLNAARKIVQDLADAHRVNLTDDQVNDAAQRLLAGGDKNDVYNRLLADIAGIEELQGQDFEDVVAIAEQMKDMPDSRERYQLETQMYSIMGRLLPARSWFERLNNIRYLAMLGNPRTHVRNITGNILMRGLTGMTESVSAVIQNALPQDQRTRAILTPGDRDLVQAARDYAYNQAYSRVFRNRDTIHNPDGTAQNVGDRFNVRFGIENARQTYGNSPVGRAIEAASKANSGFMTRVDDWFRGSEFSSSLAQQLKAQGLDASALTSTDAGIQRRVDQMVERAIADADTATFQADNWISTALSRSSNTLRNGNLSQKLLYMVEEGLLPFKRTPTNIVKTALEYNPLGATVEAIYRATHGRSAADVIDSASKGVTGTALIAIGYALASAGLLNGSGSDEEDENNFNTMQGQQAYSINIPGVGSYTIDWASPAAVPLLLGAELPSILGGDYDAGRVVDALRNMAQPVLEMTMLSGLNDTLDNLRYLDDNQSPLEAVLSSAASGYFGQFYPTVLGQIARTVDDTRRDTYGGGDSRSERDLTYNIQSLENRTPGLSTTNEPWLDAWGRPQENVGGNVLGRAAYNMLSPGYFAAENTTPVDSYLDELYDATGDTGVLPTRASSYVTIDGTRTYLTPEQRTEYASARGQTAYNIIDELMGNDAFTAMSDSDQAEAIKDVYSLANKIGTAAAVPDYTSDDKLYGVYLEDGIDGVVNYALADAAVSSAKDAAGEDASFGNAETWNAMQDLGLDDVSLVDTYLAKASDSVSERIDELVGPEGVIAYRNAYDGADRDGNGSVSKTELAIALSNSGASDDVAFRTYMATQTTTSDDGEQSTDEKAASAYQQFGASGGMNWLRYYSAYSVAKEQAQAQAKAAGESADLKGLAEGLLNQIGLSEEQKRAFFSLTNSSWKGNPF